MRQDNLKPIQPKKKKKRVGRGISSGRGKTAGRGTKGQKSRTGFNISKGFEGGQTPLKMRLPKVRGFFRKKQPLQIINLEKINNYYQAGQIVSAETLFTKHLIKSPTAITKILADGNLDKLLTFKNLIFSQSAVKKIEKSRGKIINNNK